MANLILLGVLLVVYAIIFLPQFRARQERRRAVEATTVGDEVVLNSGIHGFVSEIEDTVAWIEVSEGVELKVNRSAIERRIPADADEGDS